jgi:hypothetical protein
MKNIFLFLILTGSSFLISAQSGSLVKSIFIPHPRSEDKVHQSVLPGIEQIDFSKYEMILLGGDLTYYTSIDPTSMDYCDSLFDLGSPNTLWTMGNHDLNNRSRIEKYTGKPSFYSYSNNNTTFLVLDTELDANGFVSSHISGDQLAMIQHVCDTIVHSDYLILLHHRLLWMIGDEYFSQKIDSVGESTRQLDTSNFNTVVFPLLQQAKSRGVQVICLGGDKSKINIEYSPEDSITFISSTMAPEFTDAENDVVILSCNTQNRQLSREFVPLDKVEKNPPVISTAKASPSRNPHLKVTYNQAIGAIEVGFHSESYKQRLLEVYSLSGQSVFTGMIKPGEIKTILIREKGLYLVKCSMNGYVESQKICVN